MKHLLSFLLAALLLLTCSSAHPGSTDGQGGHTDHSTGEYHFHHGYPAHQHPNGTCIYEFDDKTGQNSGTPGGGYKATTSATTKITTKNVSVLNVTNHRHKPEFTFSDFIVLSFIILIVCYLSYVFFSEIFFSTKSQRQAKRFRNIFNLQLRKETDFRIEDAHSNFLINGTSKFNHVQITKEQLISLFGNALSDYNFDLIPSDITFTSFGLPIKGHPSDECPYGLYTVYITPHGKCYHYNFNCVKNASQTHLFAAIQNYTSCSKCVFSQQDKVIPDWYIPILLQFKKNKK